MLRYYKNGQQICFCWSILCPSGGNLVCIRRYCLYIRRKLLYDTKQQGRYIHKTIIFFSAENPSLRHPLSISYNTTMNRKNCSYPFCFSPSFQVIRGVRNLPRMAFTLFGEKQAAQGENKSVFVILKINLFLYYVNIIFYM